VPLATPELKSVRCANYIATVRFELLTLARACGYVHPALVPLDAIERLDANLSTVQLQKLFSYKPGWGMPGPADVKAITAVMSC
jgi:hypothetical protein